MYVCISFLVSSRTAAREEMAAAALQAQEVQGSALIHTYVHTCIPLDVFFCESTKLVRSDSNCTRHTIDNQKTK